MTAATFPLASSLRQSDALVGDGVTTLFGPFNFRTFAPEDIAVLIKRAGEEAYSTLDSGYAVVTVDNPADPEGWTLFQLQFATAPLSTTSFYVIGDRNQNRSMAVRKANQFDTDAIDKQLSQIGVVQQETRRELDYAVKTDRGVQPLKVVETLEEGNVPVIGANGAIKNGPDVAAIAADATRAEQARDAAEAARNAIAVPTMHTDIFVGAGAGPYNLGRAILSQAALEIFLNRDVLQPGEFTVSGTTFTLVGFAPTSEDTILVVDRTAISIGKTSPGTVDLGTLDPTSIVGKFFAGLPSLLKAFGIAEDAGDQTAKFGLLQAQAAGAAVDFGKMFPEGDWPEDIRVVNGGMLMAGARVPGKDTFDMRGFRLTKSNDYDKWTQDKAHVLPGGVLCVVYVSGSGHHSNDNMIVAKYSYDRGATWSARRVLIRPETELQSTIIGSNNDQLTGMSAGCTLGGRQFLLWMSYEASGHRHFLWHRKAPDHRKIVTGMTAETFLGTSQLRFYRTNHGYFTGDPITLPALVVGGNDLVAGGNINGLTLPSSALTVTAASDTWFEITMTGLASASQSAIAATATLQNGFGPFQKLELSSALQAAYLALWPSLPGAGLPYLHGRAIDDNGDILSFLSTSNGAHVVRITSLRGPAMTMKSMGFTGGEVTAVNCGGSKFCGFTRGSDITGSSDERSKFWRTTDDFATCTVEYARPTDLLGGQVWDENTPLCLWNGKIMAARCERTDDPLDTRPAQAASMKTYLWAADVDDVFALGINAAPFTEIATLYWSGAKTAQSSPGVGVGSWLVSDVSPEAINNAFEGVPPNFSSAFYFMGCEVRNQTGRDTDWNRGQIYGIEFTDPRQPQRAIQDGGGVDAGRTSDLNFRELKNSELGANFAASAGAYIGTPPSTPVDLTTSPDYKGGGIRLFKDAAGLVHCFGRLDYGGAANIEAIAFVLEDGWRPAYDVEFFRSAGTPTIARAGGTNLVIRILGTNNISAADRGAVHVSRQASVGLAGAVTDISFDGMCWPADGDAR
jgi:hypothetical protein